ncbi:hydrogenase maturation protease [Gordonia rhizosphera]|uniref:Putative hydrogenase maturation protease n=1 Tax=Gordonia rhizosphera NBRC 16068 TaxID=1108045 RepID=K6V5B7_9ACTN|nr:hydrogenase maturation protease [Gordonia rhizosphera]GAB91398.1 putative hydrogenase maturation protease [Gordonia rhizosphera NBRC 16068]
MTAAAAPTTTVLVAGIGNIFRRDDGFGPEVARRLTPPTESVRVVDYGIRGMHLAYDLLEPWDALVLVDAIPDRGAPGQVEVMTIDTGSTGGVVGQLAGLDGHGMDPMSVIAGVKTLGGTLPLTYVVGCQAHSIDDGIGLSAPVAAAVEPAVEAVRDLLDRLTHGPRG